MRLLLLLVTACLANSFSLYSLNNKIKLYCINNNHIEKLRYLDSELEKPNFLSKNLTQLKNYDNYTDVNENDEDYEFSNEFSGEPDSNYYKSGNYFPIDEHK